MRRWVKIQDTIFKSLMYFCTAIIIIFLGLVIGYVVVEGASHINWQFLTGDFDAQTSYVDVVIDESGLGIKVEHSKI